ncbi:MAG: hypothetical protein GYA61_07655 [Spirochaetales bacterium]|jgi:hypothetical protein|nr:hypothetical protein [Exilispira sp.]NMC68084.1 hypothetical protein [Spirochaetales bacterium]
MESLALLLFTSYPFNLVSFFGLTSYYKDSNIYLSEQYLLLIKWEDGFLIYRNNKISSIINLDYIKFLFGEFILSYGYGYLSGYLGNSLSIQYFSKPKLEIDYYLSPSDSYDNLIIKGFYIQTNPFQTKILGLSFYYDNNKENCNFLFNLNLTNFNSLILFNLFNKPNIIKINDFKFENKYQFYIGFDFSIFNLLKFAFESKFYFVNNSYFFNNWFLFISIEPFIMIRTIHKEIRDQANYYCNDGNFYQIIFNINPIFLGVYYKDYLYSSDIKKLNFEFYLKEYSLISKKLLISIYFSMPYIISDVTDIEPDYTILLKLNIFDNMVSNIYSIFSISDSLLSIKFDFYFYQIHRFVLQFFSNLNLNYYTSFSVPQVSLYDSYDFYIPPASFGMGFFYFFYINNFRLSMKVIISITDNQINKIYFYNCVYLLF